MLFSSIAAPTMTTDSTAEATPDMASGDLSQAAAGPAPGSATDVTAQRRSRRAGVTLWARLTRDGTANVLLVAAAAFWLIPLLWSIAAALDGPAQITANGWGWLPTHPTGANFSNAWTDGQFSIYLINTVIIVGGIIIVQGVTVSLAGYAFARFEFAGKRLLFALYLLQIMVPITALVLPNYQTMSSLHLIDTKWAIMLPYFASGFGTFLMRQAFRGVPPELEDAAILDGAGWLQTIRYVYLPLTRPSLAAFALVSIAFHWNDFFWPLIATNSPSNRPVSVGLALLSASQESGTQWNLIMAGVVIVILPLMAVFLVFQRAFINSFARSGLK
jgi:sn-glycerol 3-phosphate transport system permease protein